MYILLPYNPRSAAKSKLDFACKMDNAAAAIHAGLEPKRRTAELCVWQRKLWSIGSVQPFAAHFQIQSFGQLHRPENGCIQVEKLRTGVDVIAYISLGLPGSGR